MEIVLVVNALAMGEKEMDYSCIKGRIHVVEKRVFKEVIARQRYDVVMLSARLSMHEKNTLIYYINMTTSCGVVSLLSQEQECAPSLIPQAQGALWLSWKVGTLDLCRAVEWAGAMHTRMLVLYKENARLLVQMDTQRILMRAHSLLIANEGMDEVSAYAYIEKAAIEAQKSKRDMAQTILKMYL